MAARSPHAAAPAMQPTGSTISSAPRSAAFPPQSSTADAQKRLLQPRLQLPSKPSVATWPPQVELEPSTTTKQGGQKMTLTAPAAFLLDICASAAAKAGSFFGVLAARLKSCPVTGPFRNSAFFAV